MPGRGQDEVAEQYFWDLRERARKQSRARSHSRVPWQTAFAWLDVARFQFLIVWRNRLRHEQGDAYRRPSDWTPWHLARQAAGPVRKIRRQFARGSKSRNTNCLRQKDVATLGGESTYWKRVNLSATRCSYRFGCLCWVAKHYSS